jgi:predicted nucleotidyltransferase
MNELAQLLTKTNLAILEVISGWEMSLRDVAAAVSCSPAKVHQAFRLFEKQGIVSIRKYKNQRIAIVNRDNALYQKIRAMTNVSKLIGASAYKKLERGILACGLYGSYAAGTDDAGSDVDIVVISDKGEMQLRPLVRELEAELGKQISVLVMTKQKLKGLQQKDSEFYTRLKLTTTMLKGDIFG